MKKLFALFFCLFLLTQSAWPEVFYTLTESQMDELTLRIEKTQKKLDDLKASSQQDKTLLSEWKLKELEWQKKESDYSNAWHRRDETWSAALTLSEAKSDRLQASLNRLEQRAATNKWFYLAAGVGFGYGFAQLANGNSKEALYGFILGGASIGFTYIF